MLSAGTYDPRAVRAEERDGLPSFITREFDEYLRCGILEHAAGMLGSCVRSASSRLDRTPSDRRAGFSYCFPKSEVLSAGEEVMLKNKSYFKTSTGDEAGSAAKKGVISSTNKGKAYFISWSSNVKVEGENVVRHLDMTTNNHASPMATGSAPMAYGASAAIVRDP